MDIRLYQPAKRLNNTTDHATMKGYDVIEFHLNAYNGSASGTEVLIKGGLKPDALDTALLQAGAKFFNNRGFKERNDLYNMNVFAKLGISYRLIECCFIDSQADMQVYDSRLNEYVREIANAIRANCAKPIVLVAGHGDGHSGAVAFGREEASEVRRIVRLVFEELGRNPDTTPQPQPQPTPTPSPDTQVRIGDSVKIIAPHGRYIADDVQKMYGMVQVRENVLAGGANAFEWLENGIPEQCIDLTDNAGNKLPNSDITHPRRGDYFNFPKPFKVVNIATEGGKKYFKVEFDNNHSYQFWVVEERCAKV